MRRVILLGAVLGVVALLGLAAWVAVRSARMISSEVHPPRQTVERPEARGDFAGLRDVSFQDGEGVELRGWYLPPRNGALVILVHGLSGTRAQLLPEARVLAKAGHGLLLFDLGAHGESGGTVSTYGDRESGQVRAAVDFAIRQPEVDAERIGALGFSLGGYAVLKAAARDPRIRALVVEAVAVAPEQALQDELGHWGPLGLWPARQVLSRAGVDLQAVRPSEDMKALGERPLLFIGGSEDPFLPEATVQALLALARGPKERWVVPGAGHGGYALAAPEDYSRRLIAFFSRFL